MAHTFYFTRVKNVTALAREIQEKQNSLEIRRLYESLPQLQDTKDMAIQRSLSFKNK